jgi:hypothetical protein
MPVGTPLEETAQGAARDRRRDGRRCPRCRLPGLCRHRQPDQLQRPGAPVLPAQRAGMGDIQVNLVDKQARAAAEPRDCRLGARPVPPIAKKHGGNAKVVEVPPGPPVLSPIVAEVYGPDYAGQIAVAKQVRAAFEARPTSSASTTRWTRTRRKAGAARRPGQGGAARRGAEGHRRGGAHGPLRRGRDAGARRRCQVRNPGAHRAARRAPEQHRPVAEAQGAQPRRDSWCRCRKWSRSSTRCARR